MSRDDESTRFWPVLYVGQNAGKDEDGSYVWKLRDELAAALEKVDLTEVALYADRTPAIWKISHGTESTGVSDAHKKIFEDRKVIAVNSRTKAKGTSKVSQGDNFMYSIKKGDFFYLCYGSSIQLLGEITSDTPIENPEKKDGWYERSYRVIARPVRMEPYSGVHKWWTPDDNSTCIKVDDLSLFENAILQPYFNMSVGQLLGDHNATQNYWFLNANPKMWSMASMPVGEVQDYTLYNDNGNKRRIFQNFIAAKAGDMVIGYESTPVKQIVAIMRVSAEQDGEKIYFEKLEGLSSPIDFATLKACAELEKMEYFTMQQGSLFKLTRGEYDFIIDMIREENPAPAPTESIEKYSKVDFLNDVYMSEAKYDRLVAVLQKKKNIILQGAPGVGKTYAAKRLAYSIMGEVDTDRVELVQFHQNYSYEDFMMGYKPVQDGFELKYGIFYRFCQKAANHPDKDYFFIIDEINRGNMSKIFGELLMLIEADYRDTKATLAYNGLSFSVPKRLHIIGMMNTADRSLAMIDYALRRRFSFFDMEPGFDSEGFIKYQESLGNETFNTLIDRIKELNREIAQDKSLGKGFCIGHSYFCNASECTDEWMKDVVDFDILPMLSEYWFDDSGKLQRWENILHGVFQ
jgi:MoxR-like ATPase